MGSGESKSGYVIGRPSDEPPPDPIEIPFSKLEVPLGRQDQALADQYRKSLDEPFMARDDSEEVLRARAVNILRDYSRRVDVYSHDISRDCGVRGFCPKHVIDEGTVRELEPLDKLQPCQLRSCMKQQLCAQLAKFKRWIVNMKWAGSATASSQEENIPITREGLLEICESLQKLVLRLIVQAGDITENTAGTENTASTLLQTVIHSRLFYILVVAIIIVTTIVVVYLSLRPASSQAAPSVQ